jgi:hypothetical protein
VLLPPPRGAPPPPPPPSHPQAPPGHQRSLFIPSAPQPCRVLQGTGSSSSSARQLTSRITRCETAGQLFAVAARQGQEFNFIHASAAVTKLAKLPLGAPGSMQGVSHLLRLAKAHLPEMQARELANTLWAVSKLGVEEPALVAELVSRARPKLHAFKPQELANTLWALAKLDHVDSAFTGALVQAATDQLCSFDPQGLANTARALATLGHVDPVFMGALLHTGKPQLRRFKPNELTDTLWALSKMGHEDATFMSALVATPERATQLLHAATACLAAGTSDPSAAAQIYAAFSPAIGKVLPQMMAAEVSAAPCREVVFALAQFHLAVIGSWGTDDAAKLSLAHTLLEDSRLRDIMSTECLKVMLEADADADAAMRGDDAAALRAVADFMERLVIIHEGDARGEAAVESYCTISSQGAGKYGYPRGAH